MAIVIGAPASGSGKTTVTLGILAALQRRGGGIPSFKVGPDYIDPMFHQAITGLPCRNLDPFLTSESYVRWCFSHHVQDRAGAIIEGVMGLFDGKVGVEPDQPSDFASTAHVARLLDLPILLVVDASKMGGSVAALIYGLIHYDPRVQIAGVIFNRVGSQRHGQILREALSSLSVPLLGLIHTTEAITLPSRHLGLIPVGELGTFQTIQTQLADLADRSLDWEQLLPLIQTVCASGDGSQCDQYHLKISPHDPDVPPSHRSVASIRVPSPPLRIAMAWDQAFNFYYADNLDLLRQYGVELILFSPLQDGFDPVRSCDGLILGGGFPEIFAAELSEQIQAHADLTLPPTYAECGGLMVLGQSLIDQQGISHPMMGQLPYHTRMDRLTLGYRSAVALRSTLVLTPGQRVRGHEFHRSVVDPTPADPIYQWEHTLEGWSTDRIQASYLHLHWGSQPQILQRFLQGLTDLRSAP